MFEQVITVLFKAYFKTSLALIPFFIILLLLENRFRKQYSAVWKYWLFLLILIRMLIPVTAGQNQTISFHMPHIVNHNIQNNKNVEQYEMPLLHIENEQINHSENIEITADIEKSTTTQKQITQTKKLNRNWLSVLSYSWFGFVLAQLFFIVVQYVIYCKKVKRWRVNIRQKSIIELYETICQYMNIKKVPDLWLCHAIESPMCFGLFQKGIYITKQDMTKQQMKMILMHELCHYKRGDIKYQLLCLLVRVIYFYNPFVIALIKVIDRDIELSCDDMVMHYCKNENRKEYSTMLLSMMKESVCKNTILYTSFVKQKNVMKKRFENILDTSPKKTGKQLFFVLSLFILLSYGFNHFSVQQQFVLLFYVFNLFVFVSFCFLMSTKEKKKKVLFAIVALCMAVNGLLVGCEQNIQNTTVIKTARAQNYSDEQIQKLLKQKTYYVGYNSAVGNILAVIGTPDGMRSNGFEIQSKQEHYGIQVHFDIEDLSKVQSDGDGSVFGEGDSKFVMKNDVYFQFEKSSLILFSLIENLSYIDYDIRYQYEPFITFRIEKSDFITYYGIQRLFPVVLEGYTDSVESYRYFLDYVDSLKPVSYFGYEQWQKEIDDALQQIIYNEQATIHSDTQYYIDNAPNDSYNKIVQKGEQALCYFLKRFEEGTAKGLRGEIMMRVCQDIMGKSVVVQNYDNAQQWYEQYSMSYYGKYPLYSSIVEEEQNSNSVLFQNKKQVFTELERELRGKNYNAFLFSDRYICLLDLMLYSPIEGNVHQYENEKRINYYGILKNARFCDIEQNRGKMLFFTGESFFPVKITFVEIEKEGQKEIVLKEIKILRDNKELEMFCAEDKEMIEMFSGEEREYMSAISDIESKLKQYVNKNNIDVKYYCVDHKTVKEF